MNINGASVQPNVSNETANTKVLKMANDQQEMEGQMAMQLIEAASLDRLQPVGNAGHNINIKV
ncbi:cytoplasmic protein [Parashewanella spongiae]|uniref:Cytoplasmic protein n=1 Tax=Parashewanella spongiae TaxID=342950 RepID=A0A3A6TWX1_9GAMM|nr:cytoplasmic protein [Parashewanella spongiae]MCL1080140.1 cytoplasmic protein [Parashewanella spongiae]RJY16320.1 cytoplasmic protein [Parashewanella spongiae]